ncbi:MAG: hypothetical protein A3C36_00955 [Omnitrophica WOR_2 bacterium RIFCSPHIGHO2_02_FULL_52_10]|nr:MAG: hypothetical protein A3C36_00955 [Omnitrophica WOR_2 bacterium RIFCSPHIGHO2_02_FULL_52_10]
MPTQNSKEFKMTIYVKIFLPVFLYLSVAGNVDFLEAGEYSGSQADFQVGGSSIEAEEPVSAAVGGEQTIFDDFKEKMMIAVKEHERLAAENLDLRAELIELRFQVEKKERQKGIVPSRSKDHGSGLKIRDRELSESSLLLGKDAKTPVEEAQEIYLSGQTSGVGDGQRLKELFLYDLQYQVQDLELDIQLKEFWLGNVDSERKQKMDVLNAEVSTIKEQEQAMFQKVMEQERLVAGSPQQLELLKMENKMLKDKINRFQESAY